MLLFRRRWMERVTVGIIRIHDPTLRGGGGDKTGRLICRVKETPYLHPSSYRNRTARPSPAYFSSHFDVVTVLYGNGHLMWVARTRISVLDGRGSFWRRNRRGTTADGCFFRRIIEDGRWRGLVIAPDFGIRTCGAPTLGDGAVIESTSPERRSIGASSNETGFKTRESV